MRMSQVNALYFSPTGTTRRVVEAIARGMDVPAKIHDITLPSARVKNMDCRDGILIIGAPCYSGRVPKVVTKFLDSRVRMRDALVVLEITYGNRDYDDALLELKDTVESRGGKVVAMGVFLGEHSYSYDDVITAPGRPDAEDLVAAEKLGADVMGKLEGVEEISALKEIECKGNRPYKNNVKKLSEKANPPVVDGDCTHCGACANVCPSGAIDPVTFMADKVKCILCQACVKACPTKARINKSPQVTKAAHFLFDTFPERKDIEIIL